MIAYQKIPKPTSSGNQEKSDTRSGSSSILWQREGESIPSTPKWLTKTVTALSKPLRKRCCRREKDTKFSSGQVIFQKEIDSFDDYDRKVWPPKKQTAGWNTVPSPLSCVSAMSPFEFSVLKKNTVLKSKGCELQALHSFLFPLTVRMFLPILNTDLLVSTSNHLIDFFTFLLN